MQVCGSPGGESPVWDGEEQRRASCSPAAANVSVSMLGELDTGNCDFGNSGSLFLLPPLGAYGWTYFPARPRFL